jgi:uroporphyrinogen decarboxylase
MTSILMDTINALPCTRRPVWFMRQAGRYLPEYRAVREKAGDFMSLCHDTDAASEVSCQPVEILGVDAAIIFSDILVIPVAAGMDLSFVAGEGPQFAKTLPEIDLQDYDSAKSLSYVYEAIEKSVARIPKDIPLIGFCGSPWTLFAYMVQGRGSKDFARAKNLLWQDPEFAHKTIDFLTNKVIEHLTLQVQAGAQVIQVFDTWGGLLDVEDYRNFSFKALKKIATHFSLKKIPVILFTKGSGAYLPELSKTGAPILGVDWTVTMDRAREIVGEDTVLQGNMDPAVLCGDKEHMRVKLKKLLLDHGPRGGHIVNLGHGVTPEANLDTVKDFIVSAKEYSSQLMAGELK